MHHPAAKSDHADPTDKVALLRHVAWHRVPFGRLLPLGVAVATLAHGFWWLFLYPRLQALFLSLHAYDDPAYANMDWSHWLMVRAPWVFQAGSVLLTVGAIVLIIRLRDRHAATILLGLFFLQLITLVWFALTAIIVPGGGMSSAIR
jgi:hypothetical protein